jgi:hypothetical protein
MSDTAKLNEHKRSKKEQPVVGDNYNPVNMAGKKTEKNEEPSQENSPRKDEYNPVNMAGKKAGARKI